MTRRVERIAAQVMGTSSGAITDALHWAGTFHGIGARLLREYAPNLGLDQQFTIHDREDSADLLNIVRHDLGFHDSKARFPAKGTCLAIYSRTVNAQSELAETLKDHFPWAAMWEAQLRDLFAAYVEAKQAQNVLDYDDLLLYWAMMMKEPAIAADLGARFDHILVDEYQDTNRLQSAILLAIKPDGRGMTVVGDDAQSIYSFRAATVRNILDYPSSFTPAADIITLDRNYRSTAPILGGCQRHDRRSRRALHQEPVDRAAIDAEAAARHRARRGHAGQLHRRARARKARGRHARSRTRPCCSAPRTIPVRSRSS